MKNDYSLRRVCLLALLAMFMPVAMMAKQIYLKPTSLWTGDNARFAVYYADANWENGAWLDLVQVEGDEEYYTADIPDEYIGWVIFCRMNPATTENSWDNKWNQTQNVDLNDAVNNWAKDCFTIGGGSGNDYWVSWDVYTAPVVYTPKTVYFVPNTNWLSNGARFAAWGFIDGGSAEWIDMQLVSGETNVYTAQIPGQYDKFIICRMNPSTTENNWDNRWNQTADLDVNENQCYVLNQEYGQNWQNAGDWHTYTTGASLAINNSSTGEDISLYLENVVDVTLSDRTLYKDGYWNTLCLPFAVTSAMLDGATIMTLSSANVVNDGDKNVLTMSFDETDMVPAGVPFLAKWEDGDNWVAPVFNDVVVATSYPECVVFNDLGENKDYMVEFESWDFGGYELTLDDPTTQDIYFLGNENKLYSFTGTGNFGACRAFFAVYQTGEFEAAKLQVVLNFGGEATGITAVNDNKAASREGIYTLSGQRVSTPTKGLYIVNGKKLMVK